MLLNNNIPKSYVGLHYPGWSFGYGYFSVLVHWVVKGCLAWVVFWLECIGWLRTSVCVHKGTSSNPA
jgi:hypothetical protein